MKNKFENRGDHYAIFATYRGEIKEVLVDIEDFDKISSFANTWCLSGRDNLLYAVIHMGRYANPRECKMHRFITDADQSKVVDHINHNTLDNRKSNLRAVEHWQNCFNLKQVRKNRQDNMRGLQWIERLSKWQARIRIFQTDINLGFYENLEDARRSRKLAEEIHEQMMYGAAVV